MSAYRIYRVDHVCANEVHLIEASSASQAVRAVASDMFKCRVASQRDIVEAMEANTKIRRPVHESPRV